MGFEITFLGTSGGPIEGSTCSILLKPDHLSYQQLVEEQLENHLICIDAGSGLSRLSEIIRNEANGEPNSNLLSLYNDSLRIADYLKVRTTAPFTNLPSAGSSPLAQSFIIGNLIQSYLITHAHLDHICGLIINSPTFKRIKSVYGSHDTIQGLEQHIFNGLVWPRLQDYNILKFNEILPNETVNINESFTIRMFPLSHGKPPPKDVLGAAASNNLSNGSSKTENNFSYYSSCAFLVRNEFDKRYLLVFGDFESDSTSHLNLNQYIWEQIAPLINESALSAIILECSSINKSDPSCELYGHLNASNLYNELLKLNNMVLELSCNAVSLKNFNIIINHVKESEDGINDPRRIVLNELEQLDMQHGLGIKFSVALSGISVIV